MGRLSDHEDLLKLGSTCLVETGTYKGDGVAFALSIPSIIEIHSIEMHMGLYEECIRRFRDQYQVHIWQGTSAQVLPRILPHLACHRSVVWWLDAHLGSFHGSPRYDDDVELPLETELRIITSGRDVREDFFIMDDLNMYEEGSYQNGNKPWRTRYANSGGIAWAEQLLGSTHRLIRDYRREGYLIAVPITSNYKENNNGN